MQAYVCVRARAPVNMNCRSDNYEKFQLSQENVDEAEELKLEEYNQIYWRENNIYNIASPVDR